MKITFILIFLLMSIAIVAQPSWTVVNYTNSTTAYGIVTINNNPASSGDWVGAFVGNECRAKMQVIINDGKAYANLQIQGETVETVTFKVWDTSESKELDVSYTVQSNPNNKIGIPPNYLPINAESKSLNVSPTNQNVPANPAGTTNFTITSSASWTATSNQNWCTVTLSGNGSGTLVATYSSNTSTNQRTASITITVNGLTPVIITVTQAGIEVLPPSITTSTTTIPDFGNVQVNETSPAQNFTVSGSNLTGNISLTAPGGFEISKSLGSGYSASLSLTQSGGTVPNTTIYVRFIPTSAGSKYGNISGSSSGASTKNVSVRGTGVTLNADDFLIQNAKVSPTTVERGSSIGVSCDQCYTGTKLNKDMASVDIGYFLSTDTRFNLSDDVKLGSGSSNIGSDKSCSSESETFVIPEGIKAGSYYILFVADYDKKFTEGDESNNVSYVQLAIKNPCSIKLMPDALEVDSTGESYPVSVFSNDSWSIFDKPDWVNLSDTSGFGNRTTTVTVAKNSGVFRTGFITFSGCNQLIYLTVYQSGTTAIGDELVQGQIKVYPNPTTGIITVEGLSENEEVEISVFDINMRFIKKQTSTSSTTKLDISDVVSGTYLIVIDDKIDQSFKIIKE